jgi:hypothetical protein
MKTRFTLGALAAAVVVVAGAAWYGSSQAQPPGPPRKFRDGKLPAHLQQVIRDYRTVDPRLKETDFPPPQGAGGNIGFSVSGDNHLSQGGQALLRYEKTITDVSPVKWAWREGGGTFVAPRDGLYFFTVSYTAEASHEAEDDDVYVSIHHNGAHKGHAWRGEGAGLRDSASYSVVLQLRQRDYVQTFVGSDSGRPRFLPRYHFSGFLINPN